MTGAGADEQTAPEQDTIPIRTAFGTSLNRRTAAAGHGIAVVAIPVPVDPTPDASRPLRSIPPDSADERCRNASSPGWAIGPVPITMVWIAGVSSVARLIVPRWIKALGIVSRSSSSPLPRSSGATRPEPTGPVRRAMARRRLPRRRGRRLQCRPSCRVRRGVPRTTALPRTTASSRCSTPAPHTPKADAPSPRIKTPRTPRPEARSRLARQGALRPLVDDGLVTPVPRPGRSADAEWCSASSSS